MKILLSKNQLSPFFEVCVSICFQFATFSDTTKGPFFAALTLYLFALLKGSSVQGENVRSILIFKVKNVFMF